MLFTVNCSSIVRYTKSTHVAYRSPVTVMVTNQS